MNETNSLDLLNVWPRPLAWMLSSVRSSRARVERMLHLLELAEESVRYLSLFVLARYLC